jgi:outer membrane receptor protein involved in Fe transport
MLSCLGVYGWTQSSLEGQVVDATSGEALIFANVVLFKNGNLITGTQTDLDGNFVFSSIDPGTYDVEASYTGYPAMRQTGVLILAGKTIKLDFKMDLGITLDNIVVVDYKVPLIEQDNTTTGGVKTAEQIRNLPTKNINAIAATTAGLSSIDGGDINIRGSRDNATNYYVDGIRVNSRSLVPQSEIEQLQVITGGIEARYGDVTGGLISLTTKGPSAAMSGSIEVESSQLTDPYGYNLFSGNLSGPIIKNKTTNQSILGFRVSAQYRHRDEPDPQAFGVYRAKASVINQLAIDPISYASGAPILYAERLGQGDVELLKARPNVEDDRIDFTGKLDLKISDELDFTLGGSYFDLKDHFSPSRAWNLLNWQNNPYDNRNGFNLNARLRHRIGGSGLNQAPGETSESLIRNITYTLQYGFEKSFREVGDDRYEDNLFHYGYVGDFDVTWIPEVGLAQDTNGMFVTKHGDLYFEHFGFSETFADSGYTPSATINPLLNNYNLGQDVINFRNYYAYNGFWNNTVNSLYAGIHTATGAVYNLFQKEESDVHTGNVSASLDLFPGGSDKGRHNIQFGLLYEQRIDRTWWMRPRDLWTNMRFAANDAIITGLNKDVIIGVDSFTIATPNGAQTYAVNVFQNLVTENPSLLFYSKVRELTGQPLTEYVNIDGLDPNALRLDMFSAVELTDRRQMYYYGYDYTGNKLSSSTTFDDFFTATEDDVQGGRRTLPVAPNKPIYSAFYLQDKFTFKDIIFRLGLRVDRYDANTKVLRDPYSLYEIISANDFYNLDETDPRPPAVQDDWKVYVISDGSKEVRAFRDGDQWYTAEGSPVNSGSEILGNEIPYPYFVDQDAESLRDVKSRDFRREGSFVDYTPQVNWMPRLAFSFPISDEANFFVHYDILAQRPPSNTIATALDYYYWHEGPLDNDPLNNPNLKPEKTIDFEVGFKQKVTNSSAITLSAYYKELRDMIQRVQYLYVPGIPGNNYESYGNLDFGTVKGFSFSYDLRRTQNLEMTAAYTLQFADGTGSNANSQQNLNARGNIRYLSPLSFDERHRISANIDYRYGIGNQYTGPKWFGADVFSNAGVGIQVNAASGRPYTRNLKPERFGSSGISGAINGARLPWNFNVDLRADKSFKIGGVEGSKPMFANVYIRVENLFDTRNIIGVYTASGSAYDDGYLATPEGASSISQLIDSGREADVDYYLYSYQWGVVNPGFFTRPRRIYLGALLEF